MSGYAFHVMIIGGGLGGLCLAQGLKKAGISVAVYERDQTRSERLQGYRIHIEEMGNRALHSCLPPHLFDAYLKTSGSAGKGLMMSDEQLNHLMSFAADESIKEDSLKLDRSVSRITLRQLLLAEMDDIVQFDKAFTHYYKNPDGTITAFFEDGTKATGDLLVGADGGNSRVRQQLLPQASRNETGTVAIMGKVFLTPLIEDMLVSNRLDWATIVFGPKGRGFFSAVHNLSEKASERTQGVVGANEAALLEEANDLFENTNDYYFWAFLTREKNYRVHGDALQLLSGSDLLQIAEEMIENWHPTLRDLVHQTAPNTVIATPLRISTQVAPWRSRNVTLLGDAIHSMPPTRGIGGNTALKDAQLLCQKLIAVSKQEKTFTYALDEYVKEMLRYGFAAVKSSKQSLDMIVMENPVGRTFTKLLFRSAGLFNSQKKEQSPLPTS